MNLVDIKDYEGLYSFDLNTNQVWSHRYKKYLKPDLQDISGRMQQQLSKNGKQKKFKLHR